MTNQAAALMYCCQPYAQILAHQRQEDHVRGGAENHLYRARQGDSQDAAHQGKVEPQMPQAQADLGLAPDQDKKLHDQSAAKTENVGARRPRHTQSAAS